VWVTSGAAFRKRSKSRRGFLRVAIWAHYASSGLSMILLIRFSNTYEFFFYADDMKLYLPIKTSQDCLKIQSDFDRLTEWCVENSLPLNVNKCKILTFTRSFTPVTVSHVLNGIVLKRVNTITDLGVILDSKLSFRENIDSVVNKGSAMLCFIKRLSREFRDPYTLKVLFVTYVRSKLEYTICVWQPFYVTHINRIERIQEKFIKFLWNVKYENRCKVLVMDTLKKRDVARVLLIFDLLSGKIDSSYLLSQICLSVPSYLTLSRDSRNVTRQIPQDELRRF
jgi:hypothetical protein